MNEKQGGKSTSEERREKKFITEEVFERHVLKSVITRNNLIQDTIYRVEKIYTTDDNHQDVEAELTNRKGITTPIILLEFVNKNYHLLME